MTNMFPSKSASVLFLCFYFVSAKHEQYDGHTLFEVNVKDVKQAKLIHGFENQPGVDVWSHALPSRPGNILVAPDKKQEFQNLLRAAQIDFKVEVENIKEKLDLEDQLLADVAKTKNKTSGRLALDEIHRYDAVDAYLVQLADQYPNIVTVLSGGRSFEGRDIKYLKISSTNFQNTTKPVVMMESLIHAREWVTLPATLYAIHKLVIDVTEPDLLRDIDWIILPIVNPDGYEFTHTTTRFWRKNRATGYAAGNSCMGVDLNRNFNFAFGSASSSNVCSETFHGRSGFSEPETAVIRDILLQHIDRIELFLDIHSYGSMILYSYGTGMLPPNGLIIHLNGVLMAQSIDTVKWANHRDYVVGNFMSVLYPASGTAQDYAQYVGSPMSYTFELPAFNNQGGNNGFLVDPDFVGQAGYETWEGIKTGARFALNNFRVRKGMT